MLIKRGIYGLDLPHRAVSVYMYLCDRADKDGGSFPSHKTIAGDLRLSVSTVKRALNDLILAGCLEKQPRYRRNQGRTSNLYKV
jgi:predicted transcriptional regulator